MVTGLKELLSTKGEVTFVGIGNVLKKDDGIGVYICKKIEEAPHQKCVIVEQSLENYIGAINATNPDKVILIDAVDFNQTPGHVELFPVHQLTDQTSHTHNISLEKLADFFDVPAWVLGIQPGDVCFGEGFTKEVLEAAEEVVEELSSGEVIS